MGIREKYLSLLLLNELSPMSSDKERGGSKKQERKSAHKGEKCVDFRFVPHRIPNSSRTSPRPLNTVHFPHNLMLGGGSGEFVG
jgi:hypothetical protein